MKPAIAISLAVALSACSTETLDVDENQSTDNNDSVIESQVDSVRLNDIPMDQAWNNPLVIPVSWSVDSNEAEYEWELLFDGNIVLSGDQTQSSVQLSVSNVSEGTHIIKLKVCSDDTSCTQSQPILINVTKGNDSQDNGSDNTSETDMDGNNDSPDTGDDTPTDSTGDNTNDNKNPDDSSQSNNDDPVSDELEAVIKQYFDGENPDAYLEQNAMAFYDVDRFGNSRTIRNDLTGNLRGMIQFVQSHSMNPKDNNENNHPDPIAHRQALILFTPSGDSSANYSVRASVAGQFMGEVTLQHPNTLPKSDYANSDGRSDVIYSKRAFHGVLPWNWMKPGLSLEIVGESSNGQLTENNIEFGAPAELVLHNIRLGMLTEPPRSENHKFITEAVKYTTDYFQTIPVSKLVNAHYQEMQLDKVIIASGKIYDQVSDDDGSVYAGDMRQNVAKEQISTGINEANWGRSSTANRESNPQLTARITMHHAQGYYQNGVQAHGLSGGAGIGTLYSSHGNELSHELGHNYGLGHYPGRNGNDVYWAAHHADSGWGYIAHRNRMRANLHWTADNTGINVVDGIKSSEIFEDTYSYNKDAMSGGSVVSAHSAYTHHTGYSANKIQHWLAPKWIADTNYTTGFKKWENNQFVDANGAGQYRVPEKVGVPVVTLLGGYDPSAGQQKAVIYPAFVSNYGNIYDLAENAIATSQCGMDVLYGNGQIEKIALEGSRIQSGYINKFHINLESARQPEEATLYCHQNGVKNILATMDIPSSLPQIQDAVIVGEEHGFNQLESLELSQLQGELLKFDSGKDVVLDHELQSVVDSWANTDALSASAQVILDEYKNQQRKLSVLQAWINKEGAPSSEELNQLMTDLGLGSVRLPQGGAIKSDRNNACLTLKSDNSVKVETGSCESVDKKWFMDAMGKIHSVAKPEMCLLTSSSGSVVQPCENQPQFMWSEDENRRFSVATETGKCMDYTGAGEAILYNCHGYNNQKWTIESTESNSIVSRLPGSVLKYLE